MLRIPLETPVEWPSSRVAFQVEWPSGLTEGFTCLLTIPVEWTWDYSYRGTVLRKVNVTLNAFKCANSEGII